MRSSSILLAVPVIFGCGLALAQGGDLAGVTMRVLDDLSGIDAALLELEPARGEERAEGAEEADAVPATDERDEGRREEEGAEDPVPLPPA
jgi:hypothetical protein